MAALKDRDIAERGKGNPAGLSDEQILGLLQSMIKQRQESIRLYEQGNRHDLAKQEADEIASSSSSCRRRWTNKASRTR